MAYQITAAVSSCGLKSNLQDQISWKGGPSIKQDFSFSSSIIYYISKNPATSTQYLKLAQSCKYFFEKQPILIAKYIYKVNGKTKICCNDSVQCVKYGCKFCVAVDLTKLKSKIWLTYEIRLIGYNCHQNYTSLLSAKLYRSDIIEFDICKQNIMFEDFKFMVSSATEIYICDSKILYSDGNLVQLDAILEEIPYVEIFVYDCNSSIISSSTLKNITKLKNLSKLCKLVLYNIPEIDNVQDLIIFLKAIKYAEIRLAFQDTITQQMKQNLNAVVDTLIEDENSKFFIQYNGQNDENFIIMHKRFYQ